MPYSTTYYLNDVTITLSALRSLRNPQPFPSLRARTNEFHKYFLPYILEKLHIVSRKSAKLLYIVSDRCAVIL